MVSRLQKQEITEIFIEFWKEERSLWDVGSAEYKDKFAKARSFQVFKEKMGLEEKDVKTKINTLRSYFTAELKKVRSKSGKGRVADSKWPHYNSLLFLKDTVTTRKTTRSLAASAESNDVYCLNREDEMKDEPQNDMPHILDLADHQDKDFESPTFIKKPVKVSIKNPYEKKRKMKVDETKKLSYPMDSPPAPPPPKQMNYHEVDNRVDSHAEDLFGQSIAASLKSIPDKKIREYVKFKMQELIYQANVGLINFEVQSNDGGIPQQQYSCQDASCSSTRSPNYSSLSSPTPTSYCTIIRHPEPFQKL